MTKRNDTSTLFADMGKSRMTAVDIVLEGIKNLLIQKKLNPGDLLPSEFELSNQLQVSRGSIREALKILDSYGIVEIKRGNGTYVCNGANKKMFNPLLFQILVNGNEMEELIQVREMLEKEINKLVIQNASAEDLNAIENAEIKFEEEMKKCNGNYSEKSVDLDITFHKTIAAACHNLIIQEIYNFVADLFKPSMDPRRPEVIENHRGLTKSLLKRDLESANKYQGEHTVSWTFMTDKK